MKTRAFFILMLTFTLASCATDEWVEMAPAYTYDFDQSETHPRHSQYTNLVFNLTSRGVPGVLMAIDEPDQVLWLGAGGYSSLKTRTPMWSSNQTRVGSTVKTFTAVTILQLAEEGKVELDAPLSRYLSGSVLKGIDNAGQATVRQLLQHSSGIFNYIQDLKFQTASLNDLVKEWTAEELLDYARGKKAYFAPGTDCRYSNTGYILLGKIIEKVCNRPFYEEFHDRFFSPLGMHETQFASTDPIPSQLVRGYVDFFSTMKLLESTRYSGWDYHTADGGLISNPYNLTLFMRALMQGQLLNAQSMAEMMNWKTASEQDEEFYRIDYGLGIFRYHTPNGIWLGHSGDAIGYYAVFLYHPQTETSVSWATNGNYGKLDELISSKKAFDGILQTIVPE